ncbi:hypothetical protein LTS10_000737 [Elasticomyces elasticus]|nr:hypothetical protein LTS10_000737 [Elasticomyces elasticus]
MENNFTSTLATIAPRPPKYLNAIDELWYIKFILAIQVIACLMILVVLAFILWVMLRAVGSPKAKKRSTRRNYRHDVILITPQSPGARAMPISIEV